MAESTIHQVWKAFCRVVEGKPYTQRFGSSLLKEIQRFALFEFSTSQAELATHLELVPGEERPVPPFPFPKLAIIQPDCLMLLQEPEMDEGETSLEFNAVVYQHRDTLDYTIVQGRVKLDVCASMAQGEFLYSVSDMGAQVCSPSDLSNYPRTAKEIAEDEALMERISARMARAYKGLKEARQKHGTKDEVGDKVAYHRENISTLFDKFERNHEEVLSAHESMEAAQGRLLHSYFLWALKNIAWLNRPGHYIVLQGPESEYKGKRDPNRIPRLNERPRHILLDYNDIRTRWATAHGTHASPMPHLRRGHYKTLRSERFKESRGKTIWVSPCHVGGECVEWRDGDVSYKVIG